MPIAPWLERPNFLGYIEGGTNAGLALRRQADEESQFAQRAAQEQQAENSRQDDAANRLKLAYDTMAQQHDLSQQEIAARRQQAIAADALRQHAQDSLTAWRQQQGQFAQQRIVDQEQKIAAADSLKKETDKQINNALVRLDSGEPLLKVFKDNPLAASEPGFRQALAAQKSHQSQSLSRQRS